MLRIDTTMMGYLAAAVMLAGGGLWLVFDSPSHPVLRQLISGGNPVQISESRHPSREQISVMRKEVEAARDQLRRAESQGNRVGVQEALKRYDQAQRRFTSARLQSLESTAHEVEAD